MDHKFQINLGGIIDLLSNHLYSGPEVFVRELMQNATDAITARQKLEKGFVGDIRMEIHSSKGKPPTVMMSDNGIGLTPEEVHTFLATIGLSSKRALEGESQTDFIGQFGIGILSCFVVSDAITVYSKSAKADTKAVEWKAKPDGTYTLKEIDRDLEPGTQVWLTAKAGCEEHFDPARVKELAKHFGGLLPFPIRISHGKVTQIINERGAPWREKYKNDRDRHKAYLDFGREIFESDFLDAIPLKSKAGGVEGLAYVLPYAVTLTSKRAHRVYLKNMLLSENIENLLPEWAFFVKAAVNANDLRPTASRESFYEDAKLQTARETLGECLRSYLMELAEKDTRKLDKIISLHGMAIKSLATSDDDFYRLVMDWLTFETSQGEMTFGDYRKQHDTVRYVPTVDQFRQVSRVSQAHGQVVINGGYTYDSELLAKAEELLDMPTELVDPTTMSQSFDELELNEQETVAEFLRAAETVLKPFRCEPDVKKYKPRELPALYTTNQEGRFFRSLEQSKEIANPLWSGVLDNLGKKDKPQATFAHICFNFENPTVSRLCTVKDRAILHRSIQMLYLQSLLLGHHPLSVKEMTLLNDGLLSLIEWGIGMKEG